MKTLLMFSLGAFASWECAAQTSRYDAVTGILDIPCVALYANTAPVLGANNTALTYKVTMLTADTSRFTLTSAVDHTPEDECLARYDAGTGIYTDLVSLGDDAWEVTMTQSPDGSFTLYAAFPGGPAKTSLWAVSNSDNTLYLGGTVNALRESDYIPRAFDEAYADSDALYFELDLDNPAETVAGLTPAQASARAQDPEHQLLSQVLLPDTYAALGAYLADKGILISNVNQWSAQMVMTFLVADDVNELAATTEPGVASHFVDKAKEDDKPILGLETLVSQIDMLQSINEGQEDESVRNTLDGLEDGTAAEDLLAMLQSWQWGDVAAIQQQSADIRMHNRKDYDLLLTDRNNAWLEQIEVLLDTEETEMVLVGAAHVAGPEGLVTLLKDAGYTVTKY